MADKQLKAKELRAVPEADLRVQLEELRKELWYARLKTKEGALQQTQRLSVMRRQIARLLTILREQRREAAAEDRSSSVGRGKQRLV